MINTDLKVHNCIKCDMYRFRRNIVSGSGNKQSKILIIGEAPGTTEDRTGVPFTGVAGQLLRYVLNQLYIDSKQIFITNVVKCRPPNNRAPTDIELRNCRPYLLAELHITKPKIILLLGNKALKAFYPNLRTTISKERGKLKIFGNSIILATYHPAYILRNRNDAVITNEFTKDMFLLQKLVQHL